MLTIQNLSIIHAKKVILRNISHHFPTGSCTAIIGNNGAGKTSLLKAIIGQVKPTTWQITKHAKHIGYCPDSMVWYEQLTAQELRSMTQNITKYKHNIDHEIQMLQFNTYKDTPIYQLSQWNKQKVNILNSLCHNPNIYIRDEPTQHLDPESRYAVHHIMQQLRQQNKTVVYTTHFLEDIGDHTDGYIVMEQWSIWKTETNNDQTHLKQFFYTKNKK